MLDVSCPISIRVLPTLHWWLIFPFIPYWYFWAIAVLIKYVIYDILWGTYLINSCIFFPVNICVPMLKISLKTYTQIYKTLSIIKYVDLKPTNIIYLYALHRLSNTSQILFSSNKTKNRCTELPYKCTIVL